MNDLANVQKNAVSRVLSVGEKACKQSLLRASIPQKFAELHERAYIHIHDLEFYDFTYNCIGLRVQDLVKDSNLQVPTVLRKLYRGIVKLTNDQSGGIGFLSFDCDMADFGMDDDDETLVESFREFFEDLNLATRKGCEKPYTTLNIGLGMSQKARRIAKIVLEAAFRGDSHGSPFIFPNIVFKVSKDVNGQVGAPNYDLFIKAANGTANKMIPTYFNCDTEFNRAFDANKIGIMGCRTRVVSDLYGEGSGLNRGNIACVTTNLVRLAVESGHDLPTFLEKIGSLFDDCRDLLLHRFETLRKSSSPLFALENSLYKDAAKGREEAFRHGTLSIGFIGLWDALSELFSVDFSDVDNIKKYSGEALRVLKFMREKVDAYTQDCHLNFSLLASAAEGTTGTFAEQDQKDFGACCKSSAKGFYTNSFHVPVDTPIDVFEKIELEAPFHALCNGGCITYVELNEPPCRNTGAVLEIVEQAVSSGCNYFGINFPLDVCNDCGHSGRIGDVCEACGSKNIKRLRRVSGYLSEQGSFTKGKTKELLMRKASL